MLRYPLAYLAALLVLALLDVVWLTQVMKGVVESAVGALLAPKTNFTAAALFYLLYVAGLVLFAVAPALRSGSALSAALLGAAFGFCAYMTYDLTNMATLKVWPLHLAVLDIGWGTLVTGLAALGGYSAASRFA
jgi:uncharacterized membrane protein